MMCRFIFIVVVSVFISLSESATAGFEGNITFVKQTFYDTTYFVFNVKDTRVRIDEKDSKHQVTQSLIIDTRLKNIIALSPSQKMYTTIQPMTTSQRVAKSDFTVIKTDNFKYIEGYKCYLWRVRNSNLNLDVSFWVFISDFKFFHDVISLLGQTEDYSRFCLYFDHVPNNEGYFPILTVEKTLLRDEKMKVTVQHIERKKVDDHMFQIPEEYKFLRF